MVNQTYESLMIWAIVGYVLLAGLVVGLWLETEARAKARVNEGDRWRRDMPDELMSIAEAAATTKTDEADIRLAIRGGELRSWKLPLDPRLWVLKTDVLIWLTARMGERDNPRAQEVIEEPNTRFESELRMNLQRVVFYGKYRQRNPDKYEDEYNQALEYAGDLLEQDAQRAAERAAHHGLTRE